MIEGRHHIEQMELLLSFDGEEEALIEQGALSDWVNNKLLPVVDAVFAEEDLPGRVIRIDRLEIDLGRVPYHGFHQELALRLGEQLRVTVREWIHDLSPAGTGLRQWQPAGSGDTYAETGGGDDETAHAGFEECGALGRGSGGELLTEEQSELEILATYLVHGHLPWQARATEPEPMLERALGGDKEDLARLLRALPHPERVSARLVRRFRRGTVAAVAAVLAANGFGAAQRIARLQASLAGAADTPAAVEIPAQVWEELLRRLLAPDRFPQDAIIWDRLLPALSEGRPHRVAGPGAGFSVPLAGAECIKPAASSMRLTQALHTGEYRVLQPVWRELLAETPLQVVREIRAHGQDETVRRTMAECFPEELLVEIVVLLEPAEAGFVRETVSRPELFREAARLHSQEAGRIRVRLWEFTLAFLLVRQSSEFNRRSYLDSLLRQMAAHYNLDHRDLLRSLREVLAGVAATGTVKREMLGLLGGIEEQSYGPGSGGTEYAAAPAVTPIMRALADALPSIPASELAELWSALPEPAKGRVAASFAGAPLNGEDLRQALFGGGEGRGDGRQAEKLAETLLTRRLRESFVSGDADATARWWPDLVRHRPDLVLATLRQAGREGEAARNMAQGFPAGMLVGVVALLEPAESAFICGVAGRSPLIREVAATLPADPDELTRRLWEFTLIYLLVERGSEFNRRSYLGSILAKLAGHYHVSYPGIIGALRGVLTGMSISGTLRRDLLLLLEELALDASGTSAASPEGALAPSGAAASVEVAHRFELFDLPAFLSRLCSSLSEWGEIPSNLWRELLSRSATEVREVLKQAAEQGMTRRLVAVLPEKPLLAAFDRLAPGHTEFLGRLTQRAELFVANAEPAAVLKNMRRDIAEWTLCFLSVDRGSLFNRKSYLRALLDHMAARQNLDCAALVRGFLGAIQGLDYADPLRGMLYELLDESSVAGTDMGSVTVAAPGASAPSASGATAPLAAGPDSYCMAAEESATDGSPPGRAKAPEAMVAERVWNDAICEERGHGGGVLQQRPDRLQWLDEPLYRALLDYPGFGDTAPERMSEWTRILREMPAPPPELLASLPGMQSEERLSAILSWLAAARGHLFSVPPKEGKGGEVAASPVLHDIPELSPHYAPSSADAAEDATSLPERPAHHPGDQAARERGNGLAAVTPQGGVRSIAAGQPPFPGECISESEDREVGATAKAAPAVDSREAAVATGEETGGTFEESAAELKRLVFGCEPVAAGSVPAAIDTLVGRMLERWPYLLQRMLSTWSSEYAALEKLMAALSSPLLLKLSLLLAGAAGTTPQGYKPLHRRADPAPPQRPAGCPQPEIAKVGGLETGRVETGRVETGTGTMGGAEMGGGEMGGGEMGGAEMGGAEMGGAEMGGAEMGGAEMGGAEMGGAEMGGAEMGGAEMGGGAGRPLRRFVQKVEENGQQIYIQNAGLVLAAPYLPQLFGKLGLVKDGKFLDESCAERAVYLLQYMADGGSAVPPEYLLTMNKILCGIEHGQPISAEVGLEEREKEMVNGLLQAMIDNWTALGKTSIASFRESFLQREGNLWLRNEQWRLLVEPSAYDLLLQRLPWSFSIIKFPWMALPLHVEWREGL